MNSESKVMRRWTEQQRDWAKMQRGLARHAKKEHGALLMAPNNAYREQTEEYQLIQAAIPMHERHGSHYWEMSLRAHGQRFVSVGNIFSGLFCPLKDHIPPPRIIRRPKVEVALSEAGSHSTFSNKPESFNTLSWR